MEGRLMKKIIIFILLMTAFVACDNKKEESKEMFVYEEEGFGRLEMSLELPNRISSIDIYVFYQSEDERTELELRYLTIKSNAEIYYEQEKAYYESQDYEIEEEYIIEINEQKFYFFLLKENWQGNAEAVWLFETDAGLVRMISLEGEKENILPCIKEIEGSFEIYEPTFDQLFRIQAETTFDHLDNGEIPYQLPCNLEDSDVECYIDDLRRFVAFITYEHPFGTAREYHGISLSNLKYSSAIIFYEDSFYFGLDLVFRIVYITLDDPLKPIMRLYYETADDDVIEIILSAYMDDLIELQNHALEYKGLHGNYAEINFPYNKTGEGYIIDEPGHMYVAFTDRIAIKESVGMHYFWYYSMSPNVFFESHVHAVDGNLVLWYESIIRRMGFSSEIKKGVKSITLSGKQVYFFEGESETDDGYFAFWLFEENPGIIRSFTSYGEKEAVKQVIEDVENTLIIYDTSKATIEFMRSYLDYSSLGYELFNKGCSFEIADNAECYQYMSIYAIIETRKLTTNQTVDSIYQNALKKAKGNGEKVILEEIKIIGDTKVYQYVLSDSNYAYYLKGYVYFEDGKGNLIVFELYDEIDGYPYMVEYFLNKYGVNE